MLVYVWTSSWGEREGARGGGLSCKAPARLLLTRAGSLRGCCGLLVVFYREKTLNQQDLKVENRAKSRRCSMRFKKKSENVQSTTPPDCSGGGRGSEHEF